MVSLKKMVANGVNLWLKQPSLYSSVFWVGQAIVWLLISLWAFFILGPSRDSFYILMVVFFMLILTVYFQVRKVRRWRNKKKSFDK